MSSACVTSTWWRFRKGIVIVRRVLLTTKATIALEGLLARYARRGAWPAATLSDTHAIDWSGASPLLCGCGLCCAPQRLARPAHDSVQFFLTFLLWHLSLRTFLAHLRSAHLPEVSWTCDPVLAMMGV